MQSLLVNEANVELNVTEFVQLLVSESRATLNLWPFALSAVNDANFIITQNQYQTEKKPHCYVGKHLIPTVNLYFGFTPPGSERLRNVFQDLFQTGLFSYWDAEFYKLAYAKRVQDRSKVVSPTQLKTELTSTVNPLPLQGKTLMVFFLWAVCLAGCLLTFGIESALKTNIKESASHGIKCFKMSVLSRATCAINKVIIWVQTCFYHSKSCTAQRTQKFVSAKKH